ncbi:MAG: phosphotransferase enzyme family protein [Rhodococcus sp. (in: high G+C Gram-positive bacteria)]
MLALGLSMLWEQSVDPEAALRERFGFAGLDAVEAWVSLALARTWEITVDSCSRVVISDHNAIVWVHGDQGTLVVKWSRARERFSNLEASARLLRTVAEHGIPVAAPIATVDGLDRVSLDGPVGPLSVTVLPGLPGEWLDVSDDTSVRSAGAGLAEVHRVFRSVPNDDLPSLASPKALPERIWQWLTDWDRGFAPAASQRVRDRLASLPSLEDPVQLVHNDFRAANVLTRNSRVVAVLDFDDVVFDHRVNDLAKATVYLGTRFTDWRPTPAAAQLMFHAGYESVQPLSHAEREWLELLVLWHGIMAIPGRDDTAGWASAATGDSSIKSTHRSNAEVPRAQI